MADSDWRTSLSAVDRYDTIQQIKTTLEKTYPGKSGTAQKDAVVMEAQAYESASSLDQYERLCQSAGSSTSERKEEVPSEETRDEAPSSPGIRIGSYTDCKLIGTGVTSEVYKSKDRALKVIVETRNMAPHDPFREEKILKTLKPLCIPLLETFRDQEQQFVLVFPYHPFTLADILDKGPIPTEQLRIYFRDLFSALAAIHAEGMIHRDIKPSALLLESPSGPLWLADFGTAWHPRFSTPTEPANAKVLDVGTGPYRAPEVLFGDRNYGPAVDAWGAGALLAECCRDPPRPLFESRATHEDGNQLGLILSIFKTLGTPTPETWPEARHFRTPPFEMYQSYEGRSWAELLPGVEPDFVDLVAALLRYAGSRTTAEKALRHKCLTGVDDVEEQSDEESAE